MNKRTRDIAAGVIILLLGLTVVLVLIPNGIVEPKKIRIAALSPSYYPRLVGLMLVIVGALLLILRWRASRSGSKQEAASEIAGDQTHPYAIIRFVIVLLVLAAFARFLEPVGFVLTSAGALLILLLLGGERRVLPLAGISLIAPIVLYYFFVKVPRIPIPNGVLTGILPGA